MARGRKKAPAKLRLLNGRHDGVDSGGRKVEDDLDTERKAPRMPSYLPDGAKSVWKQAVKTLEPLKLLKPSDGPALEAYCTAVWQMRCAYKDINENGWVAVTENGGTRPSASVGILTKARADIRSFAREFGLTPSAESEISALASDMKKGNGDDDNPFA